MEESASRDETKLRKEETEGEEWEGTEEFCFEQGTFEMHIRNP